jgi:hypothetical protein
VPDFHIDGDAGAIRGRTAQMRTKGQTFVDTGDALAKISTGGWTGRAADKFADKFDAEPERWRKAGDGFVDAAAALETYADALDDAKRRADWAKDEYARGDRESESARTAYDADVSRARQEVADAAAEGTHMPLTILPFKDPGDAIRKNALDELSSAKADLEKAAHVAADGVRAGAANAPEKRKWYEKIGAAVGGFLTGAGEAVWDLLTMSSFSPINMLLDTHQLATGDMTPEELAAKYRMSVESVGDMVDALKEDPAEFGKQLGKGLLDWDTWADDPARALGHLVPDAVAAFFTAGAGTAATRGVKGTADAVDALSDMSKSTRALDDLGDLSDLSKADDLGDLGRTYDRFDDQPHTTSHSPEQLGDNRALDDALSDAGVTRDHMIDLINTPVADLSAADRATLTQVRDAIPSPDAGTVMQKVLTPEQIRQYLYDPPSAQSPDFDPTRVGGSVTRANDTAHLGTPDALHDGLRLDYPGTHFHPGDSSSHVIRFKTDDGFEAPRVTDLGGSDRYDSWKDPFTGNGFTKAGDDVIPEWQPAGGNPVEMREGAEMWEILDNGNQRLVGVLDNGQWVPVR